MKLRSTYSHYDYIEVWWSKEITCSLNREEREKDRERKVATALTRHSWLGTIFHSKPILEKKKRRNEWERQSHRERENERKNETMKKHFKTFWLIKSDLWLISGLWTDGFAYIMQCPERNELCGDDDDDDGWWCWWRSCYAMPIAV